MPSSRSPRCWCPTAWARWRGDRVEVACPPAARPAIRGRAGSTRPPSWGACSPSAACSYLAATYLVWDAHRLESDDLVEYFRQRAMVEAVVAGVVALVGIVVLQADARYVFDGLTSRALPLVLASAVCGLGSLRLLADGRRARGCSPSAPSAPWSSPGASRSGPTSLRESLKSPTPPHRRQRSRRCSWCSASPPHLPPVARAALHARPEEPPPRGGPGPTPGSGAVR